MQEPLLILLLWWHPQCEVGVFVPSSDVVVIRVLESGPVVVPHKIRILSFYVILTKTDVGGMGPVAPKAWLRYGVHGMHDRLHVLHLSLNVHHLSHHLFHHLNVDRESRGICGGWVCLHNSSFHWALIIGAHRLFLKCVEFCGCLSQHRASRARRC